MRSSSTVMTINPGAFGVACGWSRAYTWHSVAAVLLLGSFAASASTIFAQPIDAGVSSDTIAIDSFFSPSSIQDLPILADDGVVAFRGGFSLWSSIPAGSGHSTPILLVDESVDMGPVTPLASAAGVLTNTHGFDNPQSTTLFFIDPATGAAATFTETSDNLSFGVGMGAANNNGIALLSARLTSLLPLPPIDRHKLNAILVATPTGGDELSVSVLIQSGVTAPAGFSGDVELLVTDQQSRPVGQNGQVVLNDAGHFAFRGAALQFGLDDEGERELQSATGAIWSGSVSGGPLNLIWAQGAAAPSVPGASFGAPDNQPSINSFGHVAFGSSLVGNGIQLGDAGIWVNLGSHTDLVVRVGDSAPGRIIADSRVFTDLFINKMESPTPQLNDLGQVAFGGNTGSAISPDLGIWISEPTGDIRAIARHGDLAPGTFGSTFNSPGSFALNNLGTVVFRAMLNGGTIEGQSIWADMDGVLSLIAYEGQSIEIAPGIEKVVESLALANEGGPSDGKRSGLNDNNQLAFLAGFADGSEAVLVADIVAPEVLVGDLNRDGFVGAGDLDVLFGFWNQSVIPGSLPDLSGDGFVGAGDLDLLFGNWGASSSTASVRLVPEPSAALLPLSLLFLRWTRGHSSCRPRQQQEQGL